MGLTSVCRMIRRLFLWCAREIGDTVRLSVGECFREMELRVSAIEEKLTNLDGVVAKLRKSRGVHRSAILELEAKAQVSEERSLAMVRSLTQMAGHSAALEAHVATVKVVRREGPWLCCSLADDCISGSLRSSANKFWDEGHLHLCSRPSQGGGNYALNDAGCKRSGELLGYSSQDYFYQEHLSDGEYTYWLEWSKAVARDVVEEVFEERRMQYWSEQVNSLLSTDRFLFETVKRLASTTRRLNGRLDWIDIGATSGNFQGCWVVFSGSFGTSRRNSRGGHANIGLTKLGSIRCA
jgi:hypothetical protein